LIPVSTGATTEYARQAPSAGGSGSIIISGISFKQPEKNKTTIREINDALCLCFDPLIEDVKYV